MSQIKPFPKEDGIGKWVKSIKRRVYVCTQSRLQVYQSDAFETRFLGDKAIVIGGEEAARLFYDEEKIKRKGALPKPVLATLSGRGSVQTLDDEDHRHRKKCLWI